MKSKTLIQFSCTIGLLALVGCASMKTQTTSTQKASDDWEISDLFVQRMLAGAPSKLLPAMEEIARVLGLAEEGRLGMIKDLLANAEKRGYGITKAITRFEDVQDAFKPEYELELLRDFKKEAKYARAASSKLLLQLENEAVVAAKEARERSVKAQQEAKYVQETGGYVSPSSTQVIAEAYASNVRHIKDIEPEVARDLIVSEAHVIKDANTRYTQDLACGNKLDKAALKNKAMIKRLIGRAAVASKKMKLSAAQTEICLGAAEEAGLGQIGHVFPDSTSTELTTGELVQETLGEVCHENPNGIARKMAAERVKNGGRVVTMEQACGMRIAI